MKILHLHDSFFLSLIFNVTPIQAEAWPIWSGINRNGISSERGWDPQKKQSDFPWMEMLDHAGSFRWKDFLSQQQWFSDLSKSQMAIANISHYAI